MTPREIEQLQRLLRDSFNYPPELWTWAKTKIETDPPGITWDAILGFAKAVQEIIADEPPALRAMLRSSPTGMTGDTKISAQTVTHPDGEGTWYLANGTRIPAHETGLIALLGPRFPSQPDLGYPGNLFYRS